MKIRITPKPLAGQISAIPSKSHGHRLLICAALGGAPEDALVDIDSEDIHATRDCLAALLAPSTKDAPTPILPCRESGSTLRFLLPLALCCREKVTFTMKGRLPHRPLSPLKEELEAHGCCFSPLNQNGALTQLTLSGKLQGGTFSLPGNVSSQFITGLLFALPLLPEGGKIQITTPLESKPYLDLTLKVLSTFGIEIQEQDNAYLVPGNQRYCSPGKQRAEGDWSNLAFWITANALGSSITYTGGDL
ncbi:MAG: 3-phosphoshikimate 1-carboxyvinyltransferase, partial [Anaerovoracaceae bacterium]